MASIAERLIRQGANAPPGEVAAEVHDYLLNLASHMLHRNVRAIPLEDISTVARPKQQVDAPFSIYEQIHDRLIILQEKRV